MSENYNNTNLPDYEQYEYVDELDFRVGFGKRFLAWLIDGILFIILTNILSSIAGLDSIGETVMKEYSALLQAGSIGPFDFDLVDGFSDYIYLSVMYNAVLALAFLFTFEVFYGATVGKMILKLRIATTDRISATTGKLLKRALLKYAYYLTLVFFLVTSSYWVLALATIVGLVFFIGCFIALSSKKQALHDIIAGTAVFHKAEIMTEEEAEKVRNI